MNNSVGKIISYAFPILVTREQGEINPYLEVRLEGGKYVLNSASVNYSFGGLHHIFKTIFDKYDFSRRKLDNILILGFGAGSIASLLRKNKHIPCSITGVEKDKEVIKLMNKYFQPEEYSPLKLIHGDAFEYVINTKERYDIIVVDIFIEDNVPEQFKKQDFVEALERILDLKGILFFNKMVHTEKHKRSCTKLHSLLSNILGETIVEKVWVNQKKNWVLVHDRLSANGNSLI